METLFLSVVSFFPQKVINLAIQLAARDAGTNHLESNLASFRHCLERPFELCVGRCREIRPFTLCGVTVHSGENQGNVRPFQQPIIKIGN